MKRDEFNFPMRGKPIYVRMKHRHLQSLSIGPPGCSSCSLGACSRVSSRRCSERGDKIYISVHASVCYCCCSTFHTLQRLPLPLPVSVVALSPAPPALRTAANFCVLVVWPREAPCLLPAAAAAAAAGSCLSTCMQGLIFFCCCFFSSAVDSAKYVSKRTALTVGQQ